MEIFYMREHLLCRAQRGFSYSSFEVALDAQLPMRKGSFAEKYCKRVFHLLLAYAVDLRQEYEEYYAEEYDDFEHFLYQKMLWNKKDILDLKLTESETILELAPSRLSYNANELLEYESSGLEMINKTLEAITL